MSKREHEPDRRIEGCLQTPRWRVWFARVAFAAVFLMNVTCAFQFVCDPALFAPGFQLNGLAGQVAVQGLGVAFLMWNATYPVFVWHPRENMTLGAIVIAQQLIGCVGETCILFSLPEGFPLLTSSILRFIAFDAFGLILMGVAYALLLAACITLERD